MLQTGYIHALTLFLPILDKPLVDKLNIAQMVTLKLNENVNMKVHTMHAEHTPCCKSVINNARFHLIIKFSWLLSHSQCHLSYRLRPTQEISTMWLVMCIISCFMQYLSTNTACPVLLPTAPTTKSVIQ